MIAPATAAAVSADRKRIATAQARAALRGITLLEMQADDGRPEFVATQGAWTRAFLAIEEVEGWLDMIEGRRA